MVLSRNLLAGWPWDLKTPIIPGGDVSSLIRKGVEEIFGTEGGASSASRLASKSERILMFEVGRRVNLDDRVNGAVRQAMKPRFVARLDGRLVCDWPSLALPAPTQLEPTVDPRASPIYLYIYTYTCVYIYIYI